ncbi:MAG: hypothetical protein V2I33_25795, partial [Kangiellaceae bacterium]|nr:hypothetical protein [Kangiellaceae bacterium]
GNSGGYKSSIRLLRLPRLYRLIRITRLFKAFRMSRERNGCMSRTKAFLSLKQSPFRLAKILITVIVVAHIMA